LPINRLAPASPIGIRTGGKCARGSESGQGEVNAMVNREAGRTL